VRPSHVPFFYGWSVVAIAFVTMGVGVNARTAFSLLFPPILDEFGWPRGVTAGAFSFGFLVSARSSCRTGSCAGAGSRSASRFPVSASAQSSSCRGCSD
jgi:hypothetical protein